MTSTKLYSYYRSSAAYRVRIGLYLKNIPFEYIPVHLLNNGGEQHLATYKSLNPMSEVPCLVHENATISQSMAILQYLDDVWPTPILFPKQREKRALTIQLAEMVNSGIHPINNLKVQQELSARFKATDQDKKVWVDYWIKKGFTAIEEVLKKSAGQYCLADEITAADLFLIPQVYNAKRYQVDLSSFPLITKVEKNCLRLEAFQKASPENQPDAP